MCSATKIYFDKNLKDENFPIYGVAVQQSFHELWELLAMAADALLSVSTFGS